jgi:hypothetical protein
MKQTYTFDEDTVSCLHKDAYGCRPGSQFWAHWRSSTEAEKQAAWDSMVDAMARREAERNEFQQECIVKFEQNVDKTMSVGASDRETAIQWLMESEGGKGDVEFFEYLQGIPYGYVNKTKAV